MLRIIRTATAPVQPFASVFPFLSSGGNEHMVPIPSSARHSLDANKGLRVQRWPDRLRANFALAGEPRKKPSIPACLIHNSG